jgi:hypothetical protein
MSVEFDELVLSRHLNNLKSCYLLETVTHHEPQDSFFNEDLVKTNYEHARVAIEVNKARV